MKHKLVIEAGNNGDMSVGISGTDIKITIESNVDMEDVLSDICYKDNEVMFKKDVQNLITWVDDMGCSIDKMYVVE